MRLAVFTSKYPARVATFFERDMQGLIAAGIDVDVFPIYPQDATLWRYSLGALGEAVVARSRVHHLGLLESLAASRPWRLRETGIVLRAAGAVALSAARFGPAPLAKSLYVLPKAWAWAARHAGAYDHVLAYWGNYAATGAHLFHRLLNRPIPLSVWVHAGTDLYLRPAYLAQKLRDADVVITCCEFNRAYLVERYARTAPGIADRIHVCYHGLDLAQFPYRPEARPPARLVAVGRLAKDKGFAVLLRAARLLRDRGQAVEVEIVGAGPEGATLRALAADLGLADRVRFHGWLRFDQVRRVMSGATVLVHPSDRLGDGLPNVLREAMALGTPVIASRVAGIPEALDDGRCGLLVPPRDAGALAAAIERMLTHADLRETFARLGRSRVEEKFDVWRNGARLAERLRAVRRPAAGGRARAVAHP